MTAYHPSQSSLHYEPSVAGSSIGIETADRVYERRERTLRGLLDPPLIDGQIVSYEYCPNFEYAKESGLLDNFYYNPETGEDAIVHILSGDLRITKAGYKEAGGFHHEPSAGEETYVDHVSMSRKSPNARRNYRKRPFEPYGAEVVIKGFTKEVIRKRDDGSKYTTPASSSMFPAEYDAMTVLRAACIARDSRDISQDEPGLTIDNYFIIKAYGLAPLLDGEHGMPIRLLLEANTERIITAMPIKKTGAYMNLSQAEITRHLGLDNS